MASTATVQNKGEEAESETARENHEEVTPVEQSSHREVDAALSVVSWK